MQGPWSWGPVSFHWALMTRLQAQTCVTQLAWQHCGWPPLDLIWPSQLCSARCGEQIKHSDRQIYGVFQCLRRMWWLHLSSSFLSTWLFWWSGWPSRLSSGTKMIHHLTFLEVQLSLMDTVCVAIVSLFSHLGGLWPCFSCFCFPSITLGKACGHWICGNGSNCQSHWKHVDNWPWVHPQLSLFLKIPKQCFLCWHHVHGLFGSLTVNPC